METFQQQKILERGPIRAASFVHGSMRRASFPLTLPLDEREVSSEIDFGPRGLKFAVDLIELFESQVGCCTDYSFHTGTQIRSRCTVERSAARVMSPIDPSRYKHSNIDVHHSSSAAEKHVRILARTAWICKCGT